MKEYAIDWGKGSPEAKSKRVSKKPRKKEPERKFVVYDGAAFVPDTTDLLSFVRRYAPCRIFIETPFEPYHWETRNLIIDEAARLGVELRTISPRLTELWRREHNIKKSDQNDAVVIWAIAHEPNTVLGHARKTQERKCSPIEYVQVGRRREWPAKDVERFMQYLPPSSEAPPHVRDMLCNNGRYADTYVCAMVAASMETIDAGGGRKVFDRRTGMSSHGYPGLVRALTYCKSMCPGRVQAVLQRTHSKEDLKTMPRKELTALMQPIRRDLRRAVRWVFHQVKDRYKTQQVGLQHPAKGLDDPATASPSPGLIYPAKGLGNPGDTSPAIEVTKTVIRRARHDVLAQCLEGRWLDAAE